MPHIRLVNPSTDHPALDTIFRTTSGPAFKSEPTATIASHIYCHQYPLLSPSTCFVLEADASKEVVGYILGTSSTSTFASKWRRDLPSLLAKLNEEAGVQPSPDYAAEGRAEPTFEEDAATYLLYLVCHKSDEMLNAGIAGLWEKWPAHFHIDVLPEYQRQGWGRKLVERMFHALREEGKKGVHLGMEAGNEGTERFYKAMGFGRYPGVLDGGVSGEMGRMGDKHAVLYLVKTL